MSPANALAKAIKKAGSQTNLAKLLGTRQSTVHKWLYEQGKAPANYVIAIHDLNLGVTAHDLRPDLYNKKRVVILEAA